MFGLVRLIIRESRIAGVLWAALGIAIFVTGYINGEDRTTLGISSAGCIVVGMVCWVGAFQREAIIEKEKAAEVLRLQKIYDSGFEEGSAERDRQLALICPDCDHENQEDWLFCSSCGSRKV